MYSVKNNINKMQTVNLIGRTLYLVDTADITEKEFESPDLQAKIKRKLISVTSVPENDKFKKKKEDK